MSKFVESIKGFVNFWNILRLILILVCFGWFCINTKQVVSKFNEYNTIVGVEYNHPNQTQLPAFTICSYGVIDDKPLADEYWDQLPDFFNTNFTNDYKIRIMLRDMALKDKFAENIFNDSSINWQTMIAQCHFFPDYHQKSTKKIPCNQFSSVIESIYEGRKCFTFFSQLNISEDNYPIMKMEYEMNPFIEIVLANQSDNYFNDYLLNESFIFAIHSPNLIPSFLDVDFYQMVLERRIYYDFRFNKQITYLKPWPYKTNCRWYDSANPPGKRSRGDCLNHCINEKTFENCFNFYSVVTKDQIKSGKEKICIKSNSDHKRYANARVLCLDECQMTCVEEMIRIPYADYRRNDDQDTYIVIRSDANLYTFVHHKETIQEPDLIGNLGGHAHVWLGLSAIKIFHWIIHLVHYIKRIFYK